MLQIIISVALGFAAGYGFREIFSKPKSKMDADTRESASNHRSVMPKVSIPNTPSPIATQRKNKPQGFNLMTIEPLFKEFNTTLNDSNSFSNLLKAIEIRTYTKTLQFFSDTAIDPTSLYQLIETESSKDIKLCPIFASKEIIITDTNIGQLLSSRKLDVPNSTSREDLIQLLVSYSVTKGLKSFTDSLGRSLNEFMECYAKGENVESLYCEIMSNIKDTLSYLTQ